MTPRYSVSTIVLHWTMALVLIAAFAIGQFAEGLPRGPEKAAIMGWHALLGVGVVLLLLPRLLARLLGSNPDAGAMPAWEQKLAGATHVLFYALMLALPLSGMATVMSGAAPFKVAGLFEIPNILASYGMRGSIAAVHGVLAKLLLGAFVLHVLATFWHKLVRRDDVAGRMIPGFGS